MMPLEARTETLQELRAIVRDMSGYKERVALRNATVEELAKFLRQKMEDQRLAMRRGAFDLAVFLGFGVFCLLRSSGNSHALPVGVRVGFAIFILACAVGMIASTFRVRRRVTVLLQRVQKVLDEADSSDSKLTEVQ